MKKIISIILSMAMLLSVCTAFAVANTDDAPPVAINEALALQKLGILKGTHNGLDLSKPVTRAEAVTFISRISGAVFTDIAPASPSFDDIKGHWASDIIEKFNRAGYVGGTSDRTFTPERTVSGKEFVKILLSVMGYSDVTIDNAYGTAVDAGVLANDFSKSAVSNNRELLRSDIVRILFDSFCAKLPSGQTLHASLVEKGLFKSGDFDEVLRCDYSDGDVLFADKFNTYMPTNKNYMFSPLSIKMALALAANGAAGATKDEILRAINIKDLDFFNSYSKEMIAKYISGDVLRLDIANSIWLNTSMTDKVFSEAYKKTVADFYSGSANVVTHDNAIGKINSWVNEKTNKKIPTIIDNSEFEVMLINAIYFNGKWESKFAESLTKKADFTDRNGKKTSIDFMNKTSWMPYASMDGVQIVELPYADKRREYEGTGELIEKAESNDINVSMCVILSDKDDINPQEILTNGIANSAFKSQFVKLSLPKFKIEYDTSIEDMLVNLGIKSAFDLRTADFRRMFDSGSMCLTDALHKTFIKVDENTTEAAAVTGLPGGTGAPAPNPEPIIFNANRPFTFVIRDNINDEILFMGEYAF